MKPALCRKASYKVITAGPSSVLRRSLAAAGIPLNFVQHKTGASMMFIFD